MNRVRIVTDSTGDIPTGLAAQLHIDVVPAYIQIANRSYPDAPTPDGLGRKEFYAQLPTMSSTPTTAVPPAHEFARIYHNLSDKTEAVMAIVLSSNLSGMYSVACLGAQETPATEVHVVDSEQVTMGLGWMVIAAAEAAAEGQNISEILALVEDMKPRVHVYALLDTLEYLRRSGRVSWARAKAAQILRIKPIIEVFMGQVKNVGRTRTRRRAIEQLIELVQALGPVERLAVLHTYAPEVEEIHTRLADLYPSQRPLTVPVTTIIGAHVGPRGLGVAAVTAR